MQAYKFYIMFHPILEHSNAFCILTHMNDNYNPDWSNYSNLSCKNLKRWLPKIVREECIIRHTETVKG